MSEQPEPYRPRCMFLTCKSMLVYGEAFESDPDYQGGVVEFTCNATCRSHGPDGGEGDAGGLFGSRARVFPGVLSIVGITLRVMRASRGA